MNSDKIFGVLLTDEDLQRELKLTRAQLQRMREIYLQSTLPLEAILSPWGQKAVGITADQRKKIHDLTMANALAKLKMLGELGVGRRAEGAKEYLRRRAKMQTKLQEEIRKVITKQQWEKFESLKGKPFRRVRPKRLRSDV